VVLFLLPEGKRLSLQECRRREATARKLNGVSTIAVQEGEGK